MHGRVFRRARSPYWQVEWYAADGTRHRESSQCTDRAAALGRLRERERSAANPREHAAREATLMQALQAFVDLRHADARAGRRSPETVRCYASKAATILRVLGEGARLSAVDAATVDRFIAQRRGEGVADGTIHKELVVLRSACALAARRGTWAGTIDATFPRGFSPDYHPRERFLSRHELERLLGALAQHQAAVAAWIVATGAEWAAVVRAERGDVRADAVRVRGTKRAHRDRDIPVLFPWQSELLAWSADRAEGAGRRMFRGWCNVRRDLAAGCRRAGIDRCGPHDLRRTFGHWVRAEGASPSTLGALLGHRDGRMAERVYARRTPAELRDALARECANSARREVPAVSRVATMAGSEPLVSPSFSVPRDGIEPPTRGFSILTSPAGLSLPDRCFEAPGKPSAPTVRGRAKMTRGVA